jgi:hypothetical protein
MTERKNCAHCGESIVENKTSAFENFWMDARGWADCEGDGVTREGGGLHEPE